MPPAGDFTSAALGYLSWSRWGAAWRAARGRRLVAGCRPCPDHCYWELWRISSSLRHTSSSPERILLGPRWGEGQLLCGSRGDPRCPRPLSRDPGRAPEPGCAGLGSAWSAASGRQAGSNGPPETFPRAEARSSAPRISRTPPVAWSSNAGLGRGQRGFLLRVSPGCAFSARTFSDRTSEPAPHRPLSPRRIPSPTLPSKSSLQIWGKENALQSCPPPPLSQAPSGEWHFPAESPGAEQMKMPRKEDRL